MIKKYHKEALSPSRRKLLLIALLYFAEGLPFGFIYVSLPVFLRTEGLDLVKIGLLSLAGLAWTAKPLWAPLVDIWGRKYYWMIIALLGLMVSVLGLTFLPLNSPFYLALVFLACFFSATLDIAIDGYTIEMVSPKEMGPVNGVRVASYRVALIFSGGALVALSDFLGFKLSFVLLVLCFLFLALLILGTKDFHSASPQRDTKSIREAYFNPLRELLSRSGALWLIPFVLLFKVGDAMMGAMIYPFWVDRGFSRAEIGLISGTLGTVFSISGSFIGGFWIKSLGIRRALWLFAALQALSNLGYAYAALPGKGKVEVYAASIIESFTGGLGTAAFLAFLMGLCRRDMSASQYALLSTLFSFSRSVAGALSGFGAEHFGYATFFFYTFWAALPAFLLIPKVGGLISEK
ncbi:MFS transporter [Thermodesulfatator autotrophicus]|uniref:AmpG family muropeptide MFS transporter n=1 Tax=Thermodesulfatator autotrophicus TaxID=1795632 RepID=A0A177E8U5_9BACT|nr:MFS transporter [Thermodesulfatator autotrophicus]OAG28384.1 hypothetical protein TH606_02055 [Thermodesulfatator autotrophicus]